MYIEDEMEHDIKATKQMVLERAGEAYRNLERLEKYLPSIEQEENLISYAISRVLEEDIEYIELIKLDYMLYGIASADIMA